jgi:hypothetical protein
MNLGRIFTVLVLFGVFGTAQAADTRELVKLPEPMQEHMLSNMRNHLETLNQILAYLAAGKLDKAADAAEFNLGVSSLDKHGASHMAPFMPAPMRKLGNDMHKAATEFAHIAQEGDSLRAYQSLRHITANCVACHASYRIR